VAFNGYTLCYTSTWNKYAIGPLVKFRCGSSGETYPTMIVPPGATSLATYNTGSGTNLYGNRFTLKTPVRVIELTAMFYYGSGAAAKLKLLDSNYNVLAETRVIDLDQATGGTLFRSPITPTTLSAGTYYVVAEPQTTGNVGLYYWTSLSPSYLFASEFISTDMAQAQRTSGGSWSINTSQVMLAGMVVDRAWSTSGGFASIQ
jgi:hypothetical protein